MKCQECDGEITSKSAKKYCSRSCAAKSNNKKYPKRKKQERMKETRVCFREGCSNTFEVWRDSKKKFCGCKKPFVRDKSFILSRVEVDENGCWVWINSCHNDGYGQLGVAPYNSHVLAYTLWKGEPKSEVVRHTCHNPPCCNPDHLVEGTHWDNYHDSIESHRRAQDRRRGKPSTNRRPVEFRSERYDSIAEAMRKNKVSRNTVIKESSFL